MKDEFQPIDAADLPPIGAEDLQVLTRRAISVLAAQGAHRGVALDQKLSTLCNAFLSEKEDVRHDALTQLRRDGVRGRDIIDHVVPAAARLLGERWFADDISFVDVTIGTARLQETVRALSARADSLHRRPEIGSGAPAILIVLPRGEDHSLGVFVLADQLRRQGYAAHVAIDRSAEDVADLVRRQAFCMVGISISARQRLAQAALLVKKIRAKGIRATPIVIGGGILDLDLDALGITGADAVAQDARAALAAAGLPDRWGAPARMSWAREAGGAFPAWVGDAV